VAPAAVTRMAARTPLAAFPIFREAAPLKLLEVGVADPDWDVALVWDPLEADPVPDALPVVEMALVPLPETANVVLKVAEALVGAWAIAKSLLWANILLMLPMLTALNE